METTQIIKEYRLANWEYKTVSLGNVGNSENILNELGGDRWDLISVNSNGSDLIAFLKRELIYGSVNMTHKSIEVNDVAPAYVAPAQATVKVDASHDPRTDGWVDTGLDVNDDYVGFSFSISGDVIGSSGLTAGPEGNSDNIVLNDAIGVELPSGSLIAKVGVDGKIEPVYFSGFLAAEDHGRLYLIVNDVSYENNEGEFIVNVGLL